MERIKINMLEIASQLESGAKRDKITSQQSKKLDWYLYYRQGLLGSRVRNLALNAKLKICNFFQSSGEAMEVFELGVLSDAFELIF